jgi:predicted alpha/beta-hydrolase family hydrolase
VGEGVKQIQISVGSGAVTASVHGTSPTCIVLGHGAGGNRRTPFLVQMAERLAASGRQVVLYNFPYTEARRKVPDPPGVLEATCVAVAEHARRELGSARLVHGGKSMGGRIASQAVAKGAPADGLMFLGYPLHPPGRPETLRDRHLPEVAAPMLFLQGTRDSFARWDLIAGVAARLGPRATLHRIEGADHSFRVPRAAGLRVADVEDELAATMLAWLAQLGL